MKKKQTRGQWAKEVLSSNKDKVISHKGDVISIALHNSWSNPMYKPGSTLKIQDSWYEVVELPPYTTIKVKRIKKFYKNGKRSYW